MKEAVNLRGLVLAVSSFMVMSFGFTGAVSAASSATISETGPSSKNIIEINNKTDLDINNKNDVNIVNNNSQTAESGDATVSGNTTAGQAKSGNASNVSSFDVKIEVNNKSGLLDILGKDKYVNATIKNTGPDSVNKILIKNSLDCRETNFNNVSIYNNNQQTAVTGDANIGGEGWMFNWNNWSPDNWRSNDAGYQEWYNNFENWYKNNAEGWNVDNSNNKPIEAEDSWNGYNPLVWLSSGKSYDQWKSDFESYLNNKNDDWQKKWSSGNNLAGDAVSGDATNTAIANFDVNISNQNHCIASKTPDKHPEQGGSSTPTVNNPSQTTPTNASAGGYGGSGGYATYGGQKSPSNAINSATAPQNPGRGGQETPEPAKKGDNFSISNTGPDSYNKISSNNCADINLSNTNSFNITNNNAQNSSSGRGGVVTNSTAGSGSSGDASNYSSTSTVIKLNG